MNGAASQPPVRGARGPSRWRPTAAEYPGLALALAAGLATVFSFEPFGVAMLPAITLAVLFAVWQNLPAMAALRAGFAFGLGLFGAGVSWVYVALNTFGGMPLPLAALGTLGFCTYLAAYPALAGWLATHAAPAGGLRRLVASAAAWTFCEWARSRVLTGFSWLGVGYAELPDQGPTWLSAYAPIGGVWLASLAVALIAAALARVIASLADGNGRRACHALGCALAVLAGGRALDTLSFTHPVGDPVGVSLLQGNVRQDDKFDPGYRDETFRLYADLVRESRGRIIVLPESALPTFADRIPESFLRDLLAIAAARRGQVLAGVFTVEAPLPGATEPRYYNSVVSFGADPPGLYRKRHLVPFGETIPFDAVIGWFIRSVLSIPLADQSAGDPDQPPLPAAGQRVAVNICYEDVFGPDIRPQAAAATLLVNVTNDAWYGRSIAASQHNQIAGMRALETGRPHLRATNTGITSAFDHRGRLEARYPWFTRGVLEVTVTGREGITPYVRWGDALPVALAVVMLGVTAGLDRIAFRRRGHAAGR